MRRLRRAIAYEPVLVEDETILRLFPPLRQAWGMRGSQVCVPITGQNDRRVLYGAINLATGHRITHRGKSMRLPEFHTFLRELRRRYRTGRRIWLLLDKHGTHDSPRTVQLAESLQIVLVPLPKQCPELNPMDHLWRHAKARVSANRQFENIEQHAAAAQNWVQDLSPKEAKRKAGILSKNFWLLT